ncbi:hypothetical protein [Lentiprolixibacter aurantiacus]|uniref:Uncharacterized protein n=1 Tax=Lentiprolixibacter aurantiacus TaxID=2993939 RepID=A0AAE3ML76_9FLAO|nr:hypothetical protein [Lentiprolixibacter aurantiacus]MCX2719479.1 hypothetical protein [Lentiprolixibacter aurantiacus]
MEKIYSAEKSNCELAKARPETVQFLMDYSRSLRPVRYKKMVFEAIMN